MANKIEFRVLGSGADQFSEEMNKASKAFDDFSKVTKNLSRELNQIGSIVSLLGASISGPLVLAFNNAAKSSFIASEQVKKFQDITSKFQKEISDALVPIFEKLNNVLSNIFNAFNSLDASFRTQLIQGALLAGVFLTLSGIFTIITAKILSLVSNLAGLAGKLLLFASVHPIMLAVGVALTVIVALMFKFQSVANAVLNVFQVLFLLLQSGFLTVKAGLEEFTSSSLANIANILSALAKIPGPQQAVLQGFADNISNLSTLTNRFAYNDLQAVADKTQEIGNILVTGRGTWAMAFDDLKTKAQEFFNTLSTGGEGGTAIQGFVDGFKQGLEEIKIKLMDMNQQGIDFAHTLQTGLSTAFSNIILGTMSAKEAFTALGQTMLKYIVDYVAQWVAFQVISKVAMAAAEVLSITMAAALGAAWAAPAALVSLATFGANSGPASAGIASTVGLAQLLAAPKFNVGTPSVPRDMYANIHQGEMIVPATFSDAIRSGELSLSGGGSGGGGGVTIDLSGSTFNGVTESFVREIFTRASEAINNRTLSPLPAV